MQCNTCMFPNYLKQRQAISEETNSKNLPPCSGKVDKVVTDVDVAYETSGVTGCDVDEVYGTSEVTGCDMTISLLINV